ncbi:UNVERIFIED_ORG: putative membrane protein [Rahnella aquatilis]
MLIWMQLNGMNCSWLNNDVSDRLMSFECATAIDVLTLMIAFFGVDAQITAGTGVCCVLAFGAMHHNNHHVIIFNQIKSLYVIAQNIHPGLQCFT